MCLYSACSAMFSLLHKPRMKIEAQVISSIVIVIFGLLCFVKCTSLNPVFKTRQGYVRGFITTSDNGRMINAFVGIPYGSQERFHYPTMRKPWDNVFDAMIPGPVCPQNMVVTGPIGQEDCLVLDIYSPVESKEKNIPVLVFIHGGLFKLGGSNYFGPKRLLNENIILVVPQYRLGALGFLATTDGSLSGNYGLADQLLALEWVQQNVKEFNGDPNRVTIMGQSAGAASAHLLYLSPLSVGLFKGCILLSGSGVVPFAIRRNPDSDAQIVARNLNCPDGISGKGILECFRKASASDIVSATHQAEEQYPGFFFGPVIQRSGALRIIEKDPDELLRLGNFPKRPVILGFTRHDGLFLVNTFLKVLKKEKVEDDPEYLLKKSLGRAIELIDLKDADKALERNLTRELIAHRARRVNFGTMAHVFLDLFTLLVFSEPAFRSAQLMSGHEVPVYTYVYKYISRPHVPSYAFTSTNKLYIAEGVDHVQDLFCYFDIKVSLMMQIDFRLPMNIGTEDRQVCSRVINLLYNFVSTGQPTSNSSSINWPRFDDEGGYIVLDELLQSSDRFPTREIWTLKDPVFRPVTELGVGLAILRNPGVLLPPFIR